MAQSNKSSQEKPNSGYRIFVNYLGYHPSLRDKVLQMRSGWPDKHTQLATNISYATAICRLIYYRQPERLPNADDLHGLGAYWKFAYNSTAGKGTVDDFIRKAAPIMSLVN